MKPSRRDSAYSPARRGKVDSRRLLPSDEVRRATPAPGRRFCSTASLTLAFSPLSTVEAMMIAGIPSMYSTVLAWEEVALAASPPITSLLQLQPTQNVSAIHHTLGCDGPVRFRLPSDDSHSRRRARRRKLPGWQRGTPPEDGGSYYLHLRCAGRLLHLRLSIQVAGAANFVSRYLYKLSHRAQDIHMPVAQATPRQQLPRVSLSTILTLTSQADLFPPFS